MAIMERNWDIQSIPVRNIIQKILGDKKIINWYQGQQETERMFDKPNIRWTEDRLRSSKTTGNLEGYSFPLVWIISHKVASTILNSNTVTNSSIFDVEQTQEFIVQLLGSGWGLITWDGEKLRTWDYKNTGVINNNEVVCYYTTIDDRTICHHHYDGGFAIYEIKKGKVLSQQKFNSSVKTFFMTRKRPLWFKYQDMVQACQIAWNNYCRDIVLGGKKMFVDKSLLKMDDNGNTISPDEVAQQLFTMVEPDLRESAKNLFYEYNPELRTGENEDALTYFVANLTSAMGLGRNFLVDEKTASTYTYQNSISYITGNQQLIDTLATLTRTIIDPWQTWFSELEGQNIQIQINYDFIIDKDAERASDREDIALGIMSKVEYRMKWYMETEDEAKKNLPKDTLDSMFLPVQKSQIDDTEVKG